MGAASWVSDSFYCISYYLSWDFHCYSRASNFNLNWGQTVHCTTFNCRSVWLHFWTHQSLFLIWICVLGFEQKLKESLEVTVFFLVRQISPKWLYLHYTGSVWKFIIKSPQWAQAMNLKAQNCTFCLFLPHFWENSSFS